jgi:Tfp pilus assembly protein PilW
MMRSTYQNRGFTLIEFSIASLATMIVLASAFALMGNMFTASSTMAQIMQTQQNLRVAMNTITREITMAGTGLPSGGIAVANGEDAVPLTRQGVGGVLATPNSTIAVVAPGDGVGPVVEGVATDAISIVTIDQDSPQWTVQTFDPDGIDMEFVQNIRNGPNKLFPGDLLVFTNGSGSVFGCVTSVSTSDDHAFFEADDPMNVNQPDAASGNLKSINSVGTTTATRINIVTYYIDNSNPEHPRLMRATNAATPQLIIEDIESLQFAFDLFDFTNNTESNNQSDTASPNQIRSVNISLSGRSPAHLPTRDDRYHFSLVSKVSVRNNTFRNRFTGS